MTFPAYYGTNSGGIISVDVIAPLGGWQGYPYWMAAGTHPIAGWVNPNLLCSTNGYGWQDATGLGNPINSGTNQLEGPSLVLLTNNSLMMYCAGPSATGHGPYGLVWYNFTSPSTFTSGSTNIFGSIWGPGYTSFVSPQAIVLARGQVELWATISGTDFDGTNVAYTVSDWTGTNFHPTAVFCTGLTNSAGQQCFRPRIRNQEGVYYALATAPSNNGDMHGGLISFFVSLNGTNWNRIADNVLQPTNFPPAAENDPFNTLNSFWVASFRFTPGAPGNVFDVWATTANDYTKHLPCFWAAYPIWNPQMQASGVQSNQFAFTITGTTNLVLVVEACTDLTNPTWSPVSTNTLTGGSSYFSDPQWTKYRTRYYRLRSP
jgi:hypothetical protein